MTTRRKYDNNNNNSTAKIIKRIAALPQCVPCAELKYTPAFVEAMMATNNITEPQVQGWWHMQGHSLFKK